jgi:hypothetical protein
VNAFLPALTSVIALAFTIALVDQWRDRRRSFQLAWAVGMLCFGIGAGAEALAAVIGWNEALYRTWYLAGAVWTAGWLGLGTALLLGRTRFGYAFAASLLLAGLFTYLTQQRYAYPGSGSAPVLYLVAAGVLAVAVAVATYRGGERWPRIAVLAVAGASVLSIALMVTTTLPAPGFALDPATGTPNATLYPGTLRLLTPLLNITGGMSLALGALFSAYVLMPRRRVIEYSLEPAGQGRRFLLSVLLAPVAFTVNLVASLPGALRALVTGRLHSRVPATILIALGAFLAGSGDALLRFGVSDFVHLAKLLAVALLFLGFLVSNEVFHELRVPFTRIRLGRRNGAGLPPQDPG